MRILIISTFFPPLNSIASLRSYSWAKYWFLAGHDVTVLTTKKQIDTLSDLTFKSGDYRIIEVPSPLIMQRLKTNYHQFQKAEIQPSIKGWIKQKMASLFRYLRNKKGIFNACRMPDFMDLWISPALKAIDKEKPWDLVVSTSGPYSMHFIARAIKKRGQAKQWIADFRDPWTDNHIYKGIFPFNLFEGWIEKRILATADKLTTVSEVWGKGLALRHGRERVHVIQNGLDSENLTFLPKQSIFAENGKYRIVHTGTIYPGKQNPEPLFEAIRILESDPEISEDVLNKLEVIFVGPQMDYVLELTKKYEVSHRVRLEGFVKLEKALTMQRDAHALLFFPWNDLFGLGTGVMSGKIYEYLFSQTQLLAVGGHKMEASQQLIMDLHAGHILPTAQNIAAFLSKELKVVKKKSTGLSQEQLAPFDRKVQAFKLLELIQ